MKILILYGSISGNTEAVATTLYEQLVKGVPDYEFEILDLNSTEPGKILDYDAVIFGSSTWDDLPNPDTEDFLIRLNSSALDLTGKRFALFGLGDSAYPVFCGALPLAQAEFEKHGGKVESNFFTIDGYPDKAMEAQLYAWAEKFSQSLAATPL